MSEEQGLDRSVLERKEREELVTIAGALGVKAGSRTKKADLVDQILKAAGYEVEDRPDTPTDEAKPKRTRRTTTKAADNGEAGTEAKADGAKGDAANNGAGDSVSGNGSASASASDAPSAPAADPTPPDAPVTVEAGGDDAEAKSKAKDSGKGASGNGSDGDRSQQDQPKREGGPQQREGQRDRQQRDRQQGGQQQGGQGNQQGGQQGQGGQPRFADGDVGPGNRRSRRRRGRDRVQERDIQVQERGAEQQYQGEPIPVTGLLDLTDQGFGFVRVGGGFLPTANDVYVSVSQTRRFGLRKGDTIEGDARPPLGNEKYGAMLRIEKVSGLTVEEAKARRRFEDLTPLFPDQRLKLEQPGQPGNTTARIIDLISPIGKGQRGLIVSPPKAGKTTVMKQIAASIEANNPDVHLMVLLVDERPEEVTDMKRHLHRGEVWASTFDRPGEEHTMVAELAIERAKRLVELGKDVVIILDGITRLTRAYNMITNTGRLNQGGIDQGAIYPPKKFFGAARNLDEGGSLTILATALVETGSKGDEVIFEEFKGTGNMELRLDRRLAERRVFPAIDVNASSTRHEELLFDQKQLELVWRLRRVLNGLAEDGTPAKSLELLMEKLKQTRSNEEFLAEIARAQTV